MTRTVKVLEVLGLFNERRTQIRATDVVQLLGVSLATAYRCIEDLRPSGLLEPVGGGVYVLGPAIVELDRQLRVNDPLIAAAAEPMQGLSDRTRGTVLLCRQHGLKVLCVHEVRGTAAPGIVGYERGRAMPLYRGATSKVILAHASAAVLRMLVDKDAAGLRKAGLPVRYDALRDHLASWRAQTVMATAGEVNPQAMGWAAPLFHGEHLLGSLSVIRAKGTPPEDGLRIADQLNRSALRIGARIDASSSRHAGAHPAA